MSDSSVPSMSDQILILLVIERMLELVLAVFATYRVARIISVDTISYGIRVKIGKWAGENPRGFSFAYYLAELVNCPLCTGVWIAAFAALFLNPQSVHMWLLYWFGIAGAQNVLESWLDKPGVTIGSGR